MRHALAALFVLAVMASPTAAEQRGRGQRSQGIPPGHLPAPGECRVWYDGRPPGQQPPPTSCREAERIASRDPYARVIYGDNRDRRDDRWSNRDRRENRRNDDEWNRERERGNDRAVPRRDPSYGSRYPDTYPYPQGGTGYPDRYPGGGYASAAFDNGYNDGLQKGQEDARKDRSYDPVRHDRYRSADHGYDRRYGTKEQYKAEYRDGFRNGYEAGYREYRGIG